MTPLAFVPANLRGYLRIALLASLAFLMMTTVFPWYTATGSMSGSIQGLGSSSSSSTMTYIMWAGQPLFALLMFGSCLAGLVAVLKSRGSGLFPKLALLGSGGAFFFAILAAIVVPVGMSGSTNLGGAGSATSKVEFSLAWGGVLGVLIGLVILPSAIGAFGAAFQSKPDASQVPPSSD